jgi:hypothetical protein
MSRARAVFAASMLMMTVTTAAPLARGEPEAGDAAEVHAERSFDLGKQAIVAGRFADARQHFEASLARVPRVAAAFNLAVAYRGLGMPVETLETLARIEQGIYGAVREERREQIQKLSEEARRDIAHLDVHVTGAASASVQIDGRDVGVVERSAPLVVPANPGLHAIHVSAEGMRPIDESASVKAGERRVLTLSLTPAPRGGAPAPERRASVFRSGWFWLGAGVVVAAGTIATVYVATSPATRDPVSDPTFGVTPTFFSWR